MNKIYKVIWSKVRNCYVAVSEIAKRNGKSCTSVNCGAKANRGHAGMALAIALSLSMVGGGVAWAADSYDVNDTTLVTVTDDNDIIYYLRYNGGTTEGTGANITVANGASVNHIGSGYNGNTIVVESGGTVTRTDTNVGDGIRAGVQNNKVTVKGTVNAGVYGGLYTYTDGANVTGNTVKIDGGTVKGNVYGGYVSDGTGSAINNAVTISGSSTIGTEESSKNIYGGYAGSNNNATGDATGNAVTISGGIVTGSVYGGRAYNGSAGGDGENEGNTVNITGGTVRGWIYGGEVARYGNVTGNKVTIENSIVGDTKSVVIYGGQAFNSNGNSTVSKNTVSIGGTSTLGAVDTDGSVKHSVEIYGGYGGSTRTVDQNTVSITGGTIYNKKIYGGYATDGVATNNTLEISGGILKQHTDMFGGGSKSSALVRNNTVTIAGGSFSSKNNSNFIIGGGGRFGGPGNTSNFIDNTVNLYGTVTGLGTASLYGGYSYISKPWEGTGNDLHIGGTRTSAMQIDGTTLGPWTGKSVSGVIDNKVASVNNFNKIVLHKVNWSTTTPVLAAGNFSNIGILDISGMDIQGTKTLGTMALLKSDTLNSLDNITLTYNNTTAGTSQPIGVGISLATISNVGSDTSTTGVAVAYDGATKVTRDSDTSSETPSTSINYTISPVYTGATLGAMDWNEGYTFASGAVIKTGGLDVSFGSDFKVTDAADQENNQSFNLLNLNNSSGSISDAINTEKVTTLPVAVVKTGLTFAATRKDTIATDTNKKNLIYTTGTTRKVTTATFDGAINWDTTTPYYDASDTTVNDKGYTFDGDTGINAADLTISLTDAQKAALKKDDSMTLLSASGITTTNTVTQPTSNTVAVSNTSALGTQFGATATGTVATETGAVKYNISSVDVNTITLGSLAYGTEDTLPSDWTWTASASTTIDDTNFAYTGTANKKLKKNDTAVILNATGLTTDSHVTLGTSANKTIAMDFTDNGTEGSGINFVGTVNGHVAAADDAVNYVVIGVTLDSIDLAGWTGTAYSIADSDGWAEKTGGISVATEDMTYLPELAAGAKTDILTTTSSDIDFRNASISETNQYTASAFTPVAGNGVVKLTGMQSRGVKAGDDGKSLVYAVSKKNVNSVVLGADAGDNVTPIAWNGSEAAYSATSDYDFIGVATVDASNLSFTFTDEQKAGLSADSEMTLLSNATNLAAGKSITGANRTQTIGYNTANGAALTGTLSGTVSTVAGAVKYEAGSMTLDSVNLANWNGTSSSAVPTGWTANTSGVTVSTENMANLPNLAAGTTQEILTTGTADYFRDDKISEANKYKAYDLTPSEENKVTLSGSQSKGVKTNEDKSSLVYAVGKMDVSKISFGEMAWEIGRNASGDYDFANVATVDASDLSFTFTDEQKAALSADSEMTLLSGATNLAEGKSVTGASRTQTMDYNTANGIALSGTLAGTVSTVAGAVEYEADSMTLDSVNLANWNGTSSSAVPTGWTANASGVAVATEGMANLPNLAAGTSQEILTTETANYFSDDKISEANKYKAYDLTPSEENNVTLSGSQSKGVKTNENKSGLVYAVGKMDVSKISFGEMVWGTGRNASGDYDFANVATVDASDLAFTFTDEQKAGLSADSEMSLLSNATNLAEGKSVTGANRTQTMDYNAANGAALTGTLSGTVSTVAGAVKYEADSMTLDSVNLAGWDSTKEAATVPTGWTANAYGVTVATESMANLPNLVAGTSQEILTTGTADYFRDDKISEANKYKAYDLTPSEENKVTLSGSQSKGVKTNEDKSSLVYAVGKMDVSKISFGEMVWGTGRAASGDYDFANVATVDASDLAFTFTDEQKEVLSADSEMTLLSNATNLVAGKDVTGASRTQTMGYNTANGAALSSTLLGTVSTVAGVVKYEADSMTLDSVNLANWNGTSSSAVPTGWTANTSGVTIATDGMTVPEVAAGKHIDIVKGNAEGFFANATINGANKYQAASFEETDGGIAFKGTQSRGVTLNEEKNHIIYAMGTKNVDTAAITGEIAWDTGKAYYENTKYAFTDSSETDISGVKFTADTDPLNQSMTLITNAAGTVKDGSPEFAIALRNTSLKATATGTAAVDSGNLKYTVTGVTLDAVTVNSVGSDTIPAGWGAAKNVQVDTDSMTVPAGAAFGSPLPVMTASSAIFADENITGSKKYGANPAAFNDTDTTGAITVEGKQDAGVKASADGKSLLYEVGHKEAASVTIGAVGWNRGATLFDGSSAEYDYSGITALGTSGFDVAFSAPETVAAGESMTLLKANATLKDMAAETKSASYSFNPVAGVAIDAAITGNLAVTGGAVTYTAAENRASKLTFTNVDWKDSGALMTRPSNITFSGADVDTAKISFQNIKELEANKQMTLVSDFGDKVGTITGSKYTVGTGLEGEGAASLSGSDLIFTAKTAAKDMAAQEQTHNTLMAMEAGIALLAAGNEHISQTMDSLATPGNVGADGTAIGASMGGGASRYETGSHVSTHNWNAAVAVGSSRESKSGKLEWGVFGEYGKTSYKLHGNVGTGDGDSHYAGGGLLAKWINKHDVYTEASFRMGRMSDDAKNLLYDAMGNGYGYDVHANYFGAHVGVGKIVKYKGGRSLDVYGKYFYTKRDGVDFAAGGSSYSLDSVASSLLRIGARYGTTDKKWNWYGGLAYEYEFDGKSGGTVSTGGVSAAIRSASIKGSSVRGEIGMKMYATKTNPWQVDVSLYGYGGKHRGFGGNVNVAYMF